MARLTVDNLATSIVSKVDDGSFVASDAIIVLNQCNVHLATEVFIKELSAVDEVTASADTNTVSLPDDFLRDFVFAYNKTIDIKVKVYASRLLVDRRYRGNITSGNVMYMCNNFPNIYFKYSPSSDQLIDVYYCKEPDDLASGGDFPAYIPNNYIYNLYFNYVCANLYDYIEDGIEGEKVNTLYHQDKFDEQLEKFKLFIGPEPDSPFSPDNININFDFSDL